MGCSNSCIRRTFALGEDILPLELRSEPSNVFSCSMKTATAGNGETAIRQPNRAAKSAVKPASETDASHSAKESKIYIDGKFLPEADAKVSVFDHGLLYGDGIFEGIRFYNGRVFRLEEHLDRLWDSARSICLEIPMSR